MMKRIFSILLYALAGIVLSAGLLLSFENFLDIANDSQLTLLTRQQNGLDNPLVNHVRPATELNATLPAQVLVPTDNCRTLSSFKYRFNNCRNLQLRRIVQKIFIHRARIRVLNSTYLNNLYCFLPPFRLSKAVDTFVFALRRLLC